MKHYGTLESAYKNINEGDLITFFDKSKSRGGDIAVHGVVGYKSPKGALYIWQDLFEGKNGGKKPRGHKFSWRARQKSDGAKLVIVH